MLIQSGISYRTLLQSKENWCNSDSPPLIGGDNKRRWWWHGEITVKLHCHTPFDSVKRGMKIWNWSELRILKGGERIHRELSLLLLFRLLSRPRHSNSVYIREGLQIVEPQRNQHTQYLIWTLVEFLLLYTVFLYYTATARQTRCCLEISDNERAAISFQTYPLKGGAGVQSFVKFKWVRVRK